MIGFTFSVIKLSARALANQSGVRLGHIVLSTNQIQILCSRNLNYVTFPCFPSVTWGVFQYAKVLEISVGSQMGRSVSIPSDRNLPFHFDQHVHCPTSLFLLYIHFFPPKSLLVRNISCRFWMPYQPTLKTHDPQDKN